LICDFQSRSITLFAQEMKTRIPKWQRISILVLLLLVGLGGFVYFKTYGARLNWKNDAIAEITNRADDAKWIDREMQFITGADPEPDQRLLAGRWLSSHMILMQSGEWLIYESHCQKEAPRNITDIFIAKGSDEKWYYTTCHFCVDMIVLRASQDYEPEDIAYFVQRYHLKEFDGRSNECLKKTKTFSDPL
jgi:hypothetical protein